MRQVRKICLLVARGAGGDGGGVGYKYGTWVARRLSCRGRRGKPGPIDWMFCRRWAENDKRGSRNKAHWRVLRRNLGVKGIRWFLFRVTNESVARCSAAPKAAGFSAHSMYVGELL